MDKQLSARRKFLKGAIYATPVIMTLKAAPSFATGGSGMPRKHKKHAKKHRFEGHSQGKAYAKYKKRK